MASIKARDSVKHFELHHNVLLQSVLPGGSLYSLEITKPCEALLVPRQSSLVSTHVAPFFSASPRTSSTSPATSAASDISALFSESPRPGAGAGTTRASTVTAHGVSAHTGPTYPPEKANAFTAVMRRFLEHHLVHFDGIGNLEFTNLCGQRGAFADDLDHVKRFGRIGRVAVLADADPILPSTAATTMSTPSGAGPAVTTRGEAVAFHPSTLQLFIIEEPLMDTGELSYIVDSLRQLTTASLKASPPPQSCDLGTHEPSSEISYLMGGAAGVEVHNRNKTVAPGTTSPDLLGMIPGPGSKRSSSGSDASRSVASDLSAGETVIVEDFTDEPLEDPDLTPYVRKYTHISERQRQRSKSLQVGDSSAAVRHPTMGNHKNVREAGRRASNPPPLTCADVHQTVGPETTRTCGSTSEKRASPSVAMPSQPPSGKVHVGLTTTSTLTTSAQSDAVHTNILRHEYSPECIKDYRRVVAADNEIFYDEFERLMALRSAEPLARMLSEFVSHNQRLQQPILSNVRYNKFIEQCHTLIHKTPRLPSTKGPITVLKEGIERYVTSRLYHQLHNVSEEERRKNELLQSKLLRQENMAPDLLEALPDVERHHVWGQAMFELDGMDFFRSPREKLRCGMRACELLSLAVSDILRRRREASTQRSPSAKSPNASNGEGALAFGADEFLPCFLLLVLRARPLSFVQNVQYIEKFRNPALMSAEESYCLATLQSSITFWLHCDEKGRMTAPDRRPGFTGPPQAQGESLARQSGGSCSIGALTGPSPRLPGVLQGPPKAPRLTEKDLLPSVRQASYARRCANGSRSDNVPGGAAVLPGATAALENESPTILDVLFGWANRGLTPLAGESGSSGPKPIPSSQPQESLEDSRTKAETGKVALKSPPRGTVVSTNVVVPRAEVVQGVHSVFPLQHAASAPNFSPNGSDPPHANTRGFVRELLVTRQKSFTELTLTELQLIVEEARQMLMEQQK